MTELLGNVGLCLAVLAAAAALLVSLAATRGSARTLAAARAMVVGVLLTLSIACGALTWGLLRSDFAIQYIASYTERALPLGYKLAAFWAGQEGSLLLWAWLIAAMSVVFALSQRRQGERETATSLAVVSGVLLFFAALMLFAANPFVASREVPRDGQGLNPMLQDPWMIAHPPLLFTGYAGFLFPFAILIGALVSGRRDTAWLAQLRPWAIVAWLFLGVGILFGAQWAYVELGWGGYRAWDPVENASLLPWLTGTALLHSIMAQQHRGMFKTWNALLIAATFVLCVFGSWLTRSGVIQSVHAFERSLIGTFFLVFLAALAVLSGVVLVIRRHLLVSDHALEGLLGREGLFLATNVLLVGMTLLTLVGTIFPLISSVFASQDVTVGPKYYNKVVAPLGLVLVALMALGPMLTYGSQAAVRFGRALAGPAVGAIAVVSGALLIGYRNPWALVSAAITTIAVLAIITDLIRSVRHRAAATGENPFGALVRLIDSNHRRYGGQLVHVGILLIVIGVIGSSVFSNDQTVQFQPGERRSIGGRTVQFVSLDEVREANFTAVAATVRVTEPNGRVVTLRPQRRFYDKSEQPNAEVAIESSWRQDLYVNLAGWESGGALTAIQVIVNPLVSLMWTGGIVMIVGAIFCVTPRLLRHPPIETAAAVRETGPTRVEVKRPRAIARPVTRASTAARTGACQ
jgi:cytochrome c-type biogenesis protein CcmF